MTETILHSCGTCKHYGRADLREFMNDPDAVFTVCTWKPVQAYWMPAPFYGERAALSYAAMRKPSDGKECPVWESKTI